MSCYCSGETVICFGLGTATGLATSIVLYSNIGGLSGFLIPVGALLGGLAGKAINYIHKKYCSVDLGNLIQLPSPQIVIEPSTARLSVN